MRLPALPSVYELNLCCRLFTPVVRPQQPSVRSGFPSGRIRESQEIADKSDFAVDGCTAVSGILASAVLKSDSTVDSLTDQPGPGTASHFCRPIFPPPQELRRRADAGGFLISEVRYS